MTKLRILLFAALIIGMAILFFVFLPSKKIEQIPGESSPARSSGTSLGHLSSYLYDPPAFSLPVPPPPLPVDLPYVLEFPDEKGLLLSPPVKEFDVASFSFHDRY